MKTKEQVLAELRDCLFINSNIPRIETDKAFAILTEFEKQCEDRGAKEERDRLVQSELDEREADEELSKLKSE